MKSGPKYDPRRDYYAKKFKLCVKWWRIATQQHLDQLDACSNDTIRRILLGVSK
jgi:hypothetical protein